jgi:hypothetical protein
MRLLLFYMFFLPWGHELEIVAIRIRKGRDPSIGRKRVSFCPRLLYTVCITVCLQTNPAKR